MTKAQTIFDEDEDDLFVIPDEAADEAKIRRALADHAAGRVISNEAVMR